MAEVQQNFKNHTRFDPPWHFFIAPMFLANVIVAIVAAVRHWSENPWLYFWWIAMSVAAFLAVGKARAHSLTAQDRVIRLEEKLRYARVLTAEQAARAEGLTLRQIIALRFASDAELPGLVDRALTENLTAKQIKESVQNWRPDTVRV